MQIREIKDEDLEACSSLYTRVFSESPWSEVWSQDIALTRLRHFYKSEVFFGLLVEDKNILGFVLGNTEPFINDTWFYLREMCIDNKFQNQGIGTTLLSELKKHLTLKSVKNIYLATERDFPASYFYQKNGFLEEKKMIFFYKEL